MTRKCRTDDCTRTALHHKTFCSTCRGRIYRNCDPSTTPERIVNDLDVDIACHRRQATPGLTRAERRIVSRRLTAKGLSAAQIAHILCVAKRSVERYRQADRADSVPASSARRSLAAPPGSQDPRPAPFAPETAAQVAA